MTPTLVGVAVALILWITAFVALVATDAGRTAFQRFWSDFKALVRRRTRRTVRYVLVTYRRLTYQPTHRGQRS